MQRHGYPVPVRVIGWPYGALHPIRPARPIRRVLFAPWHPLGGGYIVPDFADANRRAYEALLAADVELTVRHIDAPGAERPLARRRRPLRAGPDGRQRRRPGRLRRRGGAREHLRLQGPPARRADGHVRPGRAPLRRHPRPGGRRLAPARPGGELGRLPRLHPLPAARRATRRCRSCWPRRPASPSRCASSCGCSWASRWTRGLRRTCSSDAGRLRPGEAYDGARAVGAGAGRRDRRRRPALLARFAATFGPARPRTLVLLAAVVDDAAIARLEAAIERPGLGEDALPDLCWRRCRGAARAARAGPRGVGLPRRRPAAGLAGEPAAVRRRAARRRGVADPRPARRAVARTDRHDFRADPREWAERVAQVVGENRWKSAQSTLLERTRGRQLAVQSKSILEL